MFELANSTIKLLDTLMQVHMKHMEGKYKRKFYVLQQKLEYEDSLPPHLKVDSVVDDLNAQLIMLLRNFRQEIGATSVPSKNV